MSKIHISFLEEGSCLVEHEESGSAVRTDRPPEYGGLGRSFSATDLLAASLGVCIATNLDSIAIRHRIPLDAIKVTVEKTLAQNPKRVARLDVVVAFDRKLQPDVLLRFERAAESCTVKQSLHPDVEVHVTITMESASRLWRDKARHVSRKPC